VTGGDATNVSGRLEPEAIRDVVRANFGRFRRCYAEAAEPRPSLTVRMFFTIGTSGSITEGRVEAQQAPELGRCVNREMRALVFPAPEGGAVRVEYPIVLSPSTLPD
jgi:hypothetical protein